MGKASRRKHERQQAKDAEWTPFEKVRVATREAAEIDRIMAAWDAESMAAMGYSEAQVREMVETSATTTFYRNNHYRVGYRQSGEGLIHLSIARLDGRDRHCWDDFQRIKNELVGADCEAVELYPAQSRTVPTRQYHLWVSLDPSYRFPFGFGAAKEPEA